MKTFWKVSVLILAFIMLGSLVSFGASTPRDKLNKALEYVDDEDYGQAVEVLEDVLMSLRERAPLKVENTTLVTEIYQFGSYKERENSVFAPGETILVYSELRNFTSQKIDEGKWAVRLREDLQLLDIDDNLIVEEKDFASLELNFMTPRFTDLFLRNTVTLSGAPSGDYKIKIVVTDAPSGKKTDFVVPVSIRGKKE